MPYFSLIFIRPVFIVSIKAVSKIELHYTKRGNIIYFLMLTILFLYSNIDRLIFP